MLHSEQPFYNEDKKKETGHHWLTKTRISSTTLFTLVKSNEPLLIKFTTSLASDSTTIERGRGKSKEDRKAKPSMIAWALSSLMELDGPLMVKLP